MDAASPPPPDLDPAPQGSFMRLWARLFGWFGPGRTRRALHLAKQQAQRAEQRLREAIDVLPEGLVFLDAEGRYVLWNKRYAEIYHRSADLFREGVKLADTLRVGVARGDYPEAVGCEEEWLKSRLGLLVNPGVRHEQRLSDGRWVMIEERLTSDGGVIGLRVDITEMKEKAEALRLALSHAEAANRAKSEFLANVSHEVRTPLNGVLGLADVLGRTPLDTGQRDLLNTIVSSASALDAILADLLDFSRLEAGRVAVTTEAFDLPKLIRDCAAPFEEAVKAKGVALEVIVDRGADARVMGDPVRLQQILTNLLSNAVKFTREGKITLRVGRAARSDRHYFEVRDSGIGFEPEDAERLFVRFEQADGSITRKYGGTGLGLAICRQLCELMGGSISATGQPGRGAVFTLMLPLPAAEDEVPAPAPDEAAIPEAGEQTLRVLVVDDNETNRKVAELILDAIGAEVVCVDNGKKAVEAVQQAPFDCVLMDIQMPEMDGLTATRLIREREAAQSMPRTPIVVVSANVMNEHRQASAAAGADEHLAKPIRAETLIASVLKAVNEPSQAAAA
jgi:signal transduction histidine kinase/CheY-like chemotaxis protein